jgi:hypothetical protein
MGLGLAQTMGLRPGSYRHRLPLRRSDPLTHATTACVILGERTRPIIGTIDRALGGRHPRALTIEPLDLRKCRGAGTRAERHSGIAGENMVGRAQESVGD